MTQRRAVHAARRFLADEAAGGIVLLAATVAALVWANSAAAHGYTELWQHHFSLGWGGWAVRESLLGWVNDGLMAMFFFVVGLEIKRELVVGELAGVRAALTPVLTALGGALVPAALYLLIVPGGPEAHGWGVPMATDIAFAVGVLAVLGRRAGSGAKLFLLSIAIADDLIAIVVIAVFYSRGIHWGWLAVALGALVLIVAMRRVAGSPWAYAVPGLVLWFSLLHSGVHATVAGVLLGLLTPARPVRGREPLDRLQSLLHPVSAFVIVPIFALANAGIVLGAGRLSDAAREPVTWAVAVGLIVGKLVGVAGTAYLLLAVGVGKLPAGMARVQIWPVAALCGIGFTVALFISDLAFGDAALRADAKIGIFIASIVSAALGALLLRITGRQQGRRGTRCATSPAGPSAGSPG